MTNGSVSAQERPIAVIHYSPAPRDGVANLIAQVFPGIAPVPFDASATVKHGRNLALCCTAEPAIQGSQYKRQAGRMRVRREISLGQSVTGTAGVKACEHQFLMRQKRPGHSRIESKRHRPEQAFAPNAELKGAYAVPNENML